MIVLPRFHRRYQWAVNDRKLEFNPGNRTPACDGRRPMPPYLDRVGGAGGRMKQFGTGQPVRRVEDRRFLTGHGRYLDDIVRPRQAHAAMLRSPHAHARTRAIDGGDAAGAPGVLAVFTGADLARTGLGTIPCMTGLTN